MKKNDKTIAGAYMYINKNTAHIVEDDLTDDNFFRFYENGTAYRNITPDELLKIAEEERNKKQMAAKKISAISVDNIDTANYFVGNINDDDTTDATEPQKAVKPNKTKDSTPSKRKAKSEPVEASQKADDVMQQFMELTDEEKKILNKLYGLRIPTGSTERKTCRFDAYFRPSTVRRLETYCKNNNLSKSEVAEMAINEYLNERSN